MVKNQTGNFNVRDCFDAIRNATIKKTLTFKNFYYLLATQH